MKNNSTGGQKNARKKRKASGHPAARLAAGLVCIAIVGVVTAAIVGMQKPGGNAVSKFFASIFSSESIEEEKFSFEAYSDNVFEEMNGGMIVASKSEFQLFDSSGKLVSNGTMAFGQPAISVGKDSAVIWNQGGSEAMIINSENKVTTLDGKSAIISASMNDGGYCAISSEESGYKGLVTVYDKSSKAIYKWYSGSGYLMDAAIAPSNTGMAALTVNENGSRAVAYSLGSEEEQGSCEIEDEICFDIDYIAENRICAVSADKAVFVNGKCEYNSEYSFEGMYLRDYSLSGSGFAVFVLGRYSTGGSGSVVSVDSNGNTIGSVEINSDVKSLSVRGKYLAIVYSDRVVLYNSSLEELGVIEDAAGVERALACANGKLLAISGYRADEYSF